MKYINIGSIIFLSSIEAFSLFVVTKGVLHGEIPVIFGHMIYGYASLVTHPMWYIFGVAEWVTFSCLNGFRLFRMFKIG